MILDSNLTFDDHIKTTVSECIARLAQISRVKHCLDRTSLLTVINALVFSKLYYCSNVWANTTEKNIRKLQAVQNYACRIVSGVRKYDHVTPHLKSLSWLPVKDPLRTNYIARKLELARKRLLRRLSVLTVEAMEFIG